MTTIHWLQITPVTVPDGIHTHNLTATTTNYPPIQHLLYKPPPSSFATSISQFQSFTASSSSNGNCGESFTDITDRDLQQPELEPEPVQPNGVDEIEVVIEKVSNNRRRIRSKVAINANLETVWGILTDYERLADIIPSLVVSQVLDKRKNFARLLQIGQQNLAFGLKFSAKGVVDCYEQEFEVLPYGQRRDIEFKMIDGDFELFEGKWSIEQ